MNSFHALMPPFVVVSMPSACNFVAPERGILLLTSPTKSFFEKGWKGDKSMEMKDNEYAVVLNGGRKERRIQGQASVLI